MSNETDLDWLARNVHVWPCGKHQPWCYVYWKGGQRAVSGNCITVIQPCVRVEMSDWLARRAELQNKPSWAGHQWPQIFQNEDGHWFGARAGWDFKAHIGGGWKGEGVSLLRDDGEYLRSGTILGDWRDTLEKRPEEFKPFTSIEDNQDQVLTQQQDNGWFERGELPPVGATVMHMGTATDKDWLEVEIIAHAQRKGFKIAVYEYPGGVSFSSATYFRPIRTERDVLLSVIVEEMNRYDTDGKLADAILAAGFSLRDK